MLFLEARRQEQSGGGLWRAVYEAPFEEGRRSVASSPRPGGLPRAVGTALSSTEVGCGLIGDLARASPDGVSSCERINHPPVSQTSARNLQSMSGYEDFFVSEWFPELCVSGALRTRCRRILQGSYRRITK